MPRDIVETLRIGMGGVDATPLRNTGGKFEVPVRLMLPPEVA